MTTTLDQRNTEAELGFLVGGGKASEMIRGRDWASHPLGPPVGWPTSLRVALSLVLNSPESMILAWGPELSFFFNDAYMPLLGPRLDWAMGERFDIVWADALAQARPIIDEALSGRSRRFVDLPWKLDTDRGAADTWWSFSYSRVLDRDGQVAGLFIFTNETTERVLADRALVESRKDLAAALDDVRHLAETLEKSVVERTAERDRLWDASPDLLVMLSHNGIYQRANPAWRAVLGHEPEEVVGRTYLDLVHPDDTDRSSEALADAASAPLPMFENRLRHKDGSYRWISWTAAPTATEVFATGRDVTAAREGEVALRQAEEQMRQSQKVEAIGQLTGGVAHDFNNLLTVIRGAVDLLRRPKLTDERRARYIDAIADTTDRAAKLTGQLLAFARRQTLRPEVFDVGSSLAALIDMIRTLAGSRIKVRLERPAAPHLVHADRSQFDTAIVNMAVNARDAMHEIGELTIRIGSAVEIPALRAHAAVPGRFVTVALSDRGAGIAPDTLERIFEPFFTTKAVGEGTGLGLSQVFGFAKQSGGEVVAESRIGEGSTFTLYLPFASGADAPLQASGENSAAPPPVGACILVVEDNADVAGFAGQTLAELGFQTVMTLNGASALAELAAGADRVDAVFTDVVMPGMTGVELAAEIRRLYPGLPVVLTSGYSSVLAEGGTHGFELLSKPYSLDELARALRAAVMRRVRG